MYPGYPSDVKVFMSECHVHTHACAHTPWPWHRFLLPLGKESKKEQTYGHIPQCIYMYNKNDTNVTIILKEKRLHSNLETLSQ